MKAKPIFLIAVLVVITATAMALAQNLILTPLSSSAKTDANQASVTGSVHLVQNKILKNGDGNVAAAVTLFAAKSPVQETESLRPVDLVVVLDRSGSMAGEKMDYALDALTRLVKDLSANDRLALVSYSNQATVQSALLPMTMENRSRMMAAISSIRPGGGTNLGAGLLSAVELIPALEETEAIRHMLVISDGLVNQGITDASGLRQIAVNANRVGITVGTVGVGEDFNEQLMTQLADFGRGRYYYLENPAAFAGLFLEEYRRLGTLAAEKLELNIKTAAGVSVVDAAGYPMEKRDGQIVVAPGSLMAGESRTIYLTFNVPTDKTGPVALADVVLSYRHQKDLHTMPIGSDLTLACVSDPKAVWASVEKEHWTQKVLKNDYNQLKRKVAEDIRRGDEKQAVERIQSYRVRQAEANSVIKSEQVTTNLEEELGSLEDQIKSTFSGPAESVMQNQKRMSKSLHYEGYKGQRAVK